VAQSSQHHPEPLRPGGLYRHLAYGPMQRSCDTNQLLTHTGDRRCAHSDKDRLFLSLHTFKTHHPSLYIIFLPCWGEGGWGGVPYLLRVLPLCHYSFPLFKHSGREPTSLLYSTIGVSQFVTLQTYHPFRSKC